MISARRVSFLLILLVTSACGLEEDSKNTAISESFIDVPLEVQKVAEDWTREKRKLKKTVTAETGESETKTIDNPDWQLELAPFSQNDIKKPGLVEKYDYRQQSNAHSYLSKDKNLKIQLIKLQPNESSWQKMEIQQGSTNPLYDSESILIIDKAARKASLTSSRKMIFGGPSSITVEWEALQTPEFTQLI